MTRSRKRYGVLLGALLGTSLTLGLGVFAGAGAAASTVAPSATSPPTTTGTPQEGKTLTGANGVWSGSPTGYKFFWTRCDKVGGSCSNISGATATTYTLGSADVGNALRFKVQATNADGTTSSSSVPTAVIVAAAAKPGPANTSTPTTTGTPQVGQKLTGDKGKWSGNPTSYKFFWTRCDKVGSNCANISGATAATYILTSTDAGNALRFKVQATNAGGSTSATSVPTAVIAAAAAKPGPANTSLPTTTGTPQVGQKLTGDNGKWSGNPTSYKLVWTRCDSGGNGCSNISGATAATYTLTSTDSGNTLRFKVEATNANGSTTATSAATALISAVAKPPATGCPAGSGTVQASQLASPARLLIASQVASPSVVHRGTGQLTLRYHVTACGGRPVQGAMVYATAIPFQQLTVPPEKATGSDGWAGINFRMLGGFPVSSKQQLIAVFVRARVSGQAILGGLSTRRLFSVPVR